LLPFAAGGLAAAMADVEYELLGDGDPVVLPHAQIRGAESAPRSVEGAEAAAQGVLER
jgi:hypothetical protein